MVSKHHSTLGLDGWHVDHAFMLIASICSMCVVYMCLLHLCCVGHGGVTMEVLMVLLSTCCHECMTRYARLLLMYCSCTLVYILLHIVHAFLAYARVTYWSHFGVIHVFLSV